MQAQAVQSGTGRNPPAIKMYTPKTKQNTRPHFCVSQSRTICPTLTQFRLLSSAHPGVQAPSHAVHRRRQATGIPPLLACTAALRARHVLQRAEAARPAAPAAARDRQAGLLERGTVEAAGLHWCWCHALGRAPILRCERLPREPFHPPRRNGRRRRWRRSQAVGREHCRASSGAGRTKGGRGLVDKRADLAAPQQRVTLLPPADTLRSGAGVTAEEAPMAHKQSCSI